MYINALKLSEVYRPKKEIQMPGVDWRRVYRRGSTFKASGESFFEDGLGTAVLTP